MNLWLSVIIQTILIMNKAVIRMLPLQLTLLLLILSNVADSFLLHRFPLSSSCNHQWSKATNTPPSLALFPSSWSSSLSSNVECDSGDGNSATAERPTQRRRAFLSSCLTVATTLSSSAANARLILDEATGEYVDVPDEDWQVAWKKRLDKASSMSADEIFQAGRGAGNLELKEGEESPASRKRRALSLCRVTEARNKAGAGTEKECTKRVLGGELDFVLGKTPTNPVRSEPIPAPAASPSVGYEPSASPSVNSETIAAPSASPTESLAHTSALSEQQSESASPSAAASASPSASADPSVVPSASPSGNDG